MIEVVLPPSKSLSIRALILHFLSKKKTKLKNLSDCDDVGYLQEALKFKNKEIFVGDGGAVARFMASLSLVGKSFVLRGTDRLHERPMKDLFDVLQDLGVEIEYLDQEGFLPARFTSPRHISGDQVRISGATSSQFISALFLVSSALPSGLTIEIIDEMVSQPYVEMTLEMLKEWGVKYEIFSDSRWKIHSGGYPPSQFEIPVDCTAASYPIAYSLLTRQPIHLVNYKSETLQGDEKFLEIAKKFGAQVLRSDQGVEIHPPKTLNALGEVDFSHMPDTSMTAMGIAALAKGESHFVGLSTLYHKESDRIHAMQEGLQKLGVKVETGDDWMKIWGNSELEISDTKVNSHSDHRIAMIFGVMSKALGLNLEISDPTCVSKSWPDFWLELAGWAGELRNVSAVILQDQEKYLIVKKPRKNHAWQFPQGGVEMGESLLQAAQRELQEECGNINVQFFDRPVGEYRYFFPLDFTRHNKSIRGAHVTFFKAQFLEGEITLDQEELEDFAWVGKEKLPDYFDECYWEIVKNFV